MSSTNKNKKKNKKKKSRKIVLLICEVLLLAILLIVAYFVGLLNKIEYVGMDNSEAGINEDLDESTLLA